MKMIETTYSTTESSSDYSVEDRKISNETKLSLLKFVYYERKSIKQAANYLKINYNTAKRILKHFRNNKVVLDLGEKQKLQKELAPIVKPIDPTQQILANLVKEITQVGSQLMSLNQEIKCNQNTLSFLVNYSQKAMMNN